MEKDIGGGHQAASHSKVPAPRRPGILFFPGILKVQSAIGIHKRILQSPAQPAGQAANLLNGRLCAPKHDSAGEYSPTTAAFASIGPAKAPFSSFLPARQTAGLRFLVGAAQPHILILRQHQGIFYSFTRTFYFIV
ncbi:hypothetical protein [Hymenobacter convexus]|uniref:hypothetical protein n=1 Tax=Hymenobacter sp. CA1UV-4 TaxID=3063782 RepID=UPI0027135061|nr:hypothetical protein [Hymenobacter sp. CA1UV-4]MDO7850336.1 hypothetical protein [Hymenobacter sp. CA1UV-4]